MYRHLPIYIHVQLYPHTFTYNIPNHRSQTHTLKTIIKQRPTTPRVTMPRFLFPSSCILAQRLFLQILCILGRSRRAIE